MDASASTRSWLYETGSLTARLRAACGCGFGVRLLRQGWDRPYVSEARALGLGSHRYALVREVLLHCSGQPLILARSIIPQEALRGGQCRLAHLGDRPLGELLFAYRNLKRESLELARIDPLHWCAPLAEKLRLGADVWGRRSVYAVAKGRILVCEFFLPAVLSLPGTET